MKSLVASASPNAIVVIIAYVLIFAVVIYFFSIRPNKQRQTKMNAMLDSLAVGDSILTQAGFYGVVIDIAEEVVVVEFGSDKHCRIPMQKEAIVSVEKAAEE